jgi:hypothetical protein
MIALNRKRPQHSDATRRRFLECDVDDARDEAAGDREQMNGSLGT